MAYDTTSDSIITLRAFRNLATSRVRRLPHRAVIYGIAAILVASFVPPVQGLLCLGLIAVAEIIEFTAAKAYLADTADDPARLGKKSVLIAANLGTALAIAIGLALIWGFAGESDRTVALSCTAIAVLYVVVASQQIFSLMILRQVLYVGTGVAVTIRDAALSGQGWSREDALQVASICVLAAFALVMSWRSAAAYREHLKRELQLASALDAAERADASKGAFVATVSHELRTPLNGVLGMAQMLLGSNLTQDQRRHVEVILDSGRTLNALLSDLLDYSKLEAGKLAIEPTVEDPRRTIDQVARLYGPVASGKGLKLEVTIAPQVPARLRFDAVRVRQCLSNLVSNAIKFTETGSVRLSLDAAPAGAGPDGAGRCLVTASVTDTGIGISAEAQQHLFQPFSQADSSIARRYGGTGLGLSIARQLAESMGGTITLSSAQGEGSEFRLTFMAGEVSAAPEQPTAPAGLGERRVLVVDDAESNRMLIRLLLQPLGIEVIEAADGASALAALARGGFDAALLDLNMPGTGGTEIAARIRRGEGGRPDLPLLAVTADSAGAGIDLGPPGFDAILRKPVDPHKLHSALIAAMQRGQPASPDLP